MRSWRGTEGAAGRGGVAATTKRTLPSQMSAPNVVRTRMEPPPPSTWSFPRVLSPTALLYMSKRAEAFQPVPEEAAVGDGVAAWAGGLLHPTSRARSLP